MTKTARTRSTVVMRHRLLIAASILLVADAQAAPDQPQTRYFARQHLPIDRNGDAGPPPIDQTVKATPSYMQLIANAMSNALAYNAAFGSFPPSLRVVRDKGFERKPIADDQGHVVYDYQMNADGNDPLFTLTDGVSAQDCRDFNAANGNGSTILPVGGATPAFGCVLLGDGRDMPYFRIASVSPSAAGYTKLLDDALAGYTAYVAAMRGEPGSLAGLGSYQRGPLSSEAGTIYPYFYSQDGRTRVFTYQDGVSPAVCRAINAAYGYGQVILQLPVTRNQGCIHDDSGRNMPYGRVADPGGAAR